MIIHLRPFAALLAFLLILSSTPRGHADGSLMVTETEITEPAYEIPPGDVTPERYIRPDWLKSVDKPHANMVQGIKPPEAGGMLHGANSLKISVLDAKTLHPIAAYHVQAAIVVYQPGQNKLFPSDENKTARGVPLNKLPWRCAALVGQLESKEVKDPSGFCRYDGLGTLDLNLEVQAKGYLPHAEFIHVPAPGAQVIVRLTRGVTLTGRLVHAETGQPWAGLEVGLTAPQEDERERFGFPIRPFHRATTGADGRFTMDDNLPPAKLQLYLPTAARSRRDLAERIEGMALRPDQDSGEGADPKETERRLNAALGSPQPIAAKLDVVDLSKGGTVDIGTIKIQSTPMLELELLFAEGVPLGDFPFELQYLDGRSEGYGDAMKGKTDAQGKARVALVGWQPGGDIAIYAPGKMEDTYQVKAVERKHPSIIPGLDTSDRQMVKEFQKEMAVKYAARPEHPNCRIVTPKPGEACAVRMIYKASPNEVNLALKFVDQATGRPLGQVQGYASERELNSALMGGVMFDHELKENPDAIRTFTVAGVDGLALVPGLLLSSNILEQETQFKSLSAQGAALRQAPQLYVVAKSPGYVPKMIEIPLDQARLGKERVCEMEPEARVRGRVVLPNGVPLTSLTLKALLQPQGRWKQVDLGGGRRVDPLVRPQLTLRNWELEKRRQAMEKAHYSMAERVNLGPDGRFEFKGFKAGAGWTAEIELGDPFPTRTIRDIELQAGDNNLGDLRYEIGGGLTMNIRDSQGKPLEGVMLQLPLCADDTLVARTDTAGYATSDLQKVKAPRQLVRLVPPWGYDASSLRHSSFLQDATIFYEAAKDLDLTSTNTLTARLERGHALFVEIPPGPARDALVVYKTNMKNLFFEPCNGNVKVERLSFGVDTVALQGLAPTADGFTLMQRCLLKQGLDLAGNNTVVVRIDNVPPGRYALRINGGIYSHPAPRRAGAKPEEPNMEFDEPIIHADLEMPDTTTTVRLAINDTELEFDLEGRPTPLDLATLDNMVFLDLEQPLSTMHTSYVRAILNQNRTSETPEALLKPMTGYSFYFTGGGGRNQPVYYRTPRLLAVPAGTYSLKVYHDSREAASPGAEPYYETTVKVPANGGKIKVGVPYDPPH